MVRRHPRWCTAGLADLEQIPSKHTARTWYVLTLLQRGHKRPEGGKKAINKKQLSQSSAAKIEQLPSSQLSKDF